MPNFSKGNRVSQPERFCKYIHRYCKQTRLDGFDYCIRHILEDRTAPFKQCMYINQPNKKRCMNAAPIKDKNDRQDNSLCPFHAKKALMKARNRFHYNSAMLNDKPSCDGGQPANLEQVEVSLEENELPLNEICPDDDFCWPEMTSECLEHAGVYTHKEVCSIMREKLLRLQQLYCGELKVLYHHLEESRRKFLAAIAKPTADAETEEQKSPKLVYRDLKEVKGRLLARIEKSTASNSLGSDTQKSQSTQGLPLASSEEINTKHLQSWLQYHRRNGTQRIFRRRILEKRAGLPKPVKLGCTFEKNGFKCSRLALTPTKFCLKHVLSDPKQVLYEKCGESNCTRPILPLEDGAGCSYHFSCELPGLLVDRVAHPSTSAEPPPLVSSMTGITSLEPEHFQSMDDIASLGLDAIAPGSLFGLERFGDPGESDTVLSEDQTDLMQIQEITLNPPEDILSESESL